MPDSGMAFNPAHLLLAQEGYYSDAAHIHTGFQRWNYFTTDSAETVSAAGYFDGAAAAGKMIKGRDLIEVDIVADIENPTTCLSSFQLKVLSV